MAPEPVGGDRTEGDDLGIMLTTAVGAKAMHSDWSYLRAIIFDGDLEVVVCVLLLLQVFQRAIDIDQEFEVSEGALICDGWSVWWRMGCGKHATYHGCHGGLAVQIRCPRGSVKRRSSKSLR